MLTQRIAQHGQHQRRAEQQTHGDGHETCPRPLWRLFQMFGRQGLVTRITHRAAQAGLLGWLVF